MGCGCGRKKNKETQPQQSVVRKAGGKVPVRRVTRARSAASRAASAPLRLSYYVIAPDGSEERYGTLAEAQTVMRRRGHESGYKIESRRE